jgi:hypothetical protein
MDSTGHVSVEFDDYYFSFHPLDPDDFVSDAVGQEARVGKNIEEDRKRHGRPVDSVAINWLDTKLMLQHASRVNKACDGGAHKYYLRGDNCASNAVELLSAGARAPFHAHKTMHDLWAEIKDQGVFRPLTSRPTSARDNHTRLLERARAETEHVMIFCGQRGQLRKLGDALLPLLLVDVASRMFCWTPGDTATFARELATHNLGARPRSAWM